MKLRLTSRISLSFVFLAAVLLATVGALSYHSGSESLKAAADFGDARHSGRKGGCARMPGSRSVWTISDSLPFKPDVVQKADDLIVAAPGSEQARSAHAILMLELEPHLIPSARYYVIELFVMEPEGGKVLALDQSGRRRKIEAGLPLL